MSAQAEATPTVLFEGRGLCALDKPAGLAMHAGTGVDDESGTLRGFVQGRWPIEPGFSGPSFLGRLDRPTSGVVLAALTREGLQLVQGPWASGDVEKAYLALVHGRPAEGGVIEYPLAARRPRHRGTGRVEEAVTRFWSLCRPPRRAGARAREGASLLLVFLDTGRTHQIRRHMKAIGHPLVGDARYGDRSRDRALALDDDGLLLHCWRLRFGEEIEGVPRELVAPPPARFERACRALGLDLEAALGRAAELGPPEAEEDDDAGA